ncbi:hypothetical protein KJ570_01230 [Patescibacteria group bacterium]|nr:hypothetical protein [Patescibacteria group bacterium]MBU2035970.1 hypothetical protein [Patescibacteria group bacterium]
MIKKIIAVSLTLLFAGFILLASLLRVSSTSYSFYEEENLSYLQNLEESDSHNKEDIDIKYFFPYPGKILPDNSLYFLKASRDKIWLLLNTNPSKRAEILLLFSDKRLVSSRILFEKGKPNIAFSTLTKAEKYLEQAALQNEDNRKKGIDTTSFDLKLATASLKHWQELRDLTNYAPEEMKPEIIKNISYSRNAYVLVRDSLLSKNINPPFNPFGE